MQNRIYFDGRTLFIYPADPEKWLSISIKLDMLDPNEFLNFVQELRKSDADYPDLVVRAMGIKMGKPIDEIREDVVNFIRP